MKYRVVEHSWEQSSVYEGDNPICLVQIDGNVTEEIQDEFEKEMDKRAQIICDALNKADLAQSLADALEECTDRLELFLSTFGDMGDQYSTQADLNDWQAALANYRKGES